MIRRLLKPLVLAYINHIDSSVKKEFVYFYDLVHHSWNYDENYETFLKKSNTPKNLFRRERFYNLISSLNLIEDSTGYFVECGSWLGLSSALLCSELRARDALFTGKKYMIIDSFEGLSKPESADKLPSTVAGNYAGTMDQVKNTLADFPDIAYVKGWIPKIFEALPEKEYSFVHVDLDLIQPTVGAIEYFYSRMKIGGVLVCDDFACHVAWPNLKPSILEALQRLGVKNWLETSTGQLIIIKR